MNVLVTGGAGLIGMALRRRLASAGHTVTTTDITDFGRDDPDLIPLALSDHGGLAALARKNAIEAIVHSGGVSGPVMQANRPAHIAQTNTTATAALISIASDLDARFLLMSSHVIYGDCGQETIFEARPPHPHTFYAASKVGAEAFVASARSVFGLQAASLRIARVYGPYRRANCFLRQILLDCADHRTTSIPCDPAFPYHYVHVDDVVEAVLACLEAPLTHPAYNVTSGEVLTMPQIAEIAQNVLPEAEIVLLSGQDDAPELQSDFSLDRIRHDTGWTPHYSLEAGFTAYLNAFRANRECLL